MTIVITGASRGIGATLAAQYKDAGEEVIGTARGAEAEAVLDVTDPASHAAFANQLKDRPLDLLICNAGVYLDKGMIRKPASVPISGRRVSRPM